MFQVTDDNQIVATKTLVMSINDILLQWSRTYDNGQDDSIAGNYQWMYPATVMYPEAQVTEPIAIT